MRQRILLALAAVITSTTMERPNVSAAATPTKPTATPVGPRSGLPDLAPTVGKAASEVDLLTKKLGPRLRALMGEKAYEFMLEVWNVETPIELEEGVFHANGCERHNCGDVGYHVFIDPARDNINVFAYFGGKGTDYHEKDAIALPKGFASHFAAVRSDYEITPR
jgi:hypothetical protein